jgi:hypothetical protein
MNAEIMSAPRSVSRCSVVKCKNLAIGFHLNLCNKHYRSARAAQVNLFSTFYNQVEG